jgi:hypothetical protein
MALQPYTPVEDPNPSRINSQANGVIAANDFDSEVLIKFVKVVIIIVFSHLIFRVFSNLSLIFNLLSIASILLLWGCLLLAFFSVFLQNKSILQWKTMLKTKNTKLILKSSILKRGDITEFSFSRELRWNKSLPIMGTLYWRVSCSEVTCTRGSTDSYSHHILWTEDLSPTLLSAGANAVQGSNWVVLPNHLPATLPARGGNNQNYTESWIEWQVQISSQITDFDLSDSRFVLTVE